jgi:peptide-methionine (S)-S-oxide reductase
MQSMYVIMDVHATYLDADATTDDYFTIQYYCTRQDRDETTNAVGGKRQEEVSGSDEHSIQHSAYQFVALIRSTRSGEYESDKVPIACWHAGCTRIITLLLQKSRISVHLDTRLQDKVVEMKMNNETIAVNAKAPLVESSSACSATLEVVEVLDTMVTSLHAAVLEINMNDEIVVLTTNSPLVGGNSSCDVTLDVLNLEGLQLAVLEMKMDDEIVVLDANLPLMGSSSSCDVTFEVVDVLHLESLQVAEMRMDDETILVLDVNLPLADSCDVLEAAEEVPETAHLNNDRHEVCTFALGCFWGAELAFQRVPGVVGTTVGFSQGFTVNPTYDEVCTGTTHHREAVQVVFDTTVTSFPVLLQTALDRLAATAQPSSLSSNFDGASQLFDTEEEKMSPSKQYHHGVYYHTDEQRLAVEEMIRLDHNIYEIELLPAKTFYTAEDSHQKYLNKGGQCARKGANEPIRCYG